MFYLSVLSISVACVDCPVSHQIVLFLLNNAGWNFIVLVSRQGKIRLSEFFSQYSESDKRRILREITSEVLPRAPKMCNIIEKGTYKFVYRRYASLYFVVGVPEGMNELIVLEQIHLFVEALDGYFNSGESRCLDSAFRLCIPLIIVFLL